MSGKTRRGDFILIAALCAAGLVMGLLLLLTRKPGAAAEVRVDGKTVMTIPLSGAGEYIIEGAGGTNTLVIEDGCARVSEASCPDGLCAETGSVRYEGQSIICLPNKVVIEIKGGEQVSDDLDLDLIAGGSV